MRLISSLRCAAAICLASILAAGCAAGRQGQYVPPEAISSPAAKMSDAVLALGKKVQDDQITGYRRRAREDLLRTGVRDFFEGGNYSDSTLQAAVPSAEDLLCRPNYAVVRLAAPVQATTTRATSIKELLKSPADEWKPLLKSLAKTYTVDVTSPDAIGSYDGWAKTVQGQRCKLLVSEGDPYATRGNIGRESALAGLAAFKTMFDAVWGIVKPAVIGTLQNVEVERRNAAVVAYFSDEKAVAAFKSDIERMESFISSEFAYQQRVAAGWALYEERKFVDPRADHWKAATAALSATGCRVAVAAGPKDPSLPKRVECLKAAFTPVDNAMKAALDAGDAFDEQFDKAVPESKLSTQVDSIVAIAKGNMPDDERLKALWGTLLRYQTLYGTWKDATNDENSEKIKDAWKTFIEATKK